MKTAKAIPTKAAIFSYFQGHHLALEVYDKTSINESDVEKRLRAAGGAHQPSDMKFPGGGHPVKLGVDLLSSSGVSSSTSTPKPTAGVSAAAPTQMPKPTSFYVKSSAPVATTETINLATTPVAAVTSATSTTTTSGATSSAINAIIEKGKGLAASGEPVSAADVSALIAELEVIAKSLI